MEYWKAPERNLTSPHHQHLDLMRLIKSPPLTGEWINSKIISKSPQTPSLKDLLNVRLLDMCASRLSYLPPESVNDDIITIVKMARIVLIRIEKEISSGNPNLEQVHKFAMAFAKILKQCASKDVAETSKYFVQNLSKSNILH